MGRFMLAEEAAGRGYAKVAKRLPVSATSLHQWAKRQRPATSGGLVPVVIDSEEQWRASAVSVVTPRGLRTEGLDDIVHLVERLG